MTFEIGMTGSYTATVEPGHTADAVGNPGVAVLATPTLTLFCEMAAHHAIVDAFEPGQSSVGFHNDLYHLAATPVGETVTVTARLSAIDGKRLTFDISGRDGTNEIVKGIHERVLVRLDAFLAGIRRRGDRS